MLIGNILSINNINDINNINNIFSNIKYFEKKE